MERTISNGIHSDITIKEYHANTSHISATSIKQAKVSLKHFDWHRRGILPKKEGVHMDYGNAFELALLDKVGFASEVAIEQTQAWIEKANSERLKDGKEPYKQVKSSGIYQAEQSKFYAQNEGKYKILDVGPQSYEYVERMLESCYQDAVIQKLISGIEYQLSLFWTDEKTGLNLKTRPDICRVKQNVIVNLKTAVDGSPQAFGKDLAKYDYPIQAAIEIMGVLRTGLMPAIDKYFWLVVEKEPPFNATIYEFTESDIAYAFDELDYLLNKIATAEKENKWPGYSDRADNRHGILEARIPLWYKSIF